ncbi:nitroreductase family protein [Taibaiella soli]|uniref:NAD(P)H-dependent oxidoreductase n=1 Tax=Taibaiella soli TaxID=1649169 RepID=A0A2W2AJP4_9BACT|nr:nitroreductase family protein [Taibaiella soli]PZF73762.1 NAD(P)H-dependent oxidoreductase [Taibaiella soli]
MDFLQALNWRYATKRMNGEAVPQEKVDRIVEAARLSASSMGLQPYSIIVVENPELREKIKSVAFNQPQITESSHLLIFAAWTEINESHIQDYIDNIIETRGVPAETLNDFKNTMLRVTDRAQDVNHQWAARQAYIAFGTAIAAAAVEKVDATPMEGFNSDELDALLGLKEKGLKSVTLLPLGYRNEEADFLANAAKVRRASDKLVISLN